MHRRTFIQRIVNAGALASFSQVFTRGTASAVMIRHDVEERSYIGLGARDEFQAGRITMLDRRGNYTGVLISNRHVLTVGHPIVGYLPAGESQGAVSVKIRILGADYETDHAVLHPQYDRIPHFGGADLAVIRLKAPGVSKLRPATIWSGGLKLGERFVGVGQGKSGTGRDNNEPKPDGIFRGYENTIDYMHPEKDSAEFRADFDNGTEQFNTLSRALLGVEKEPYQGQSSKLPMPLEGTTAAGDSGSGVWVMRNDVYCLAGIASFRHFSMYGGQAGYADLSASKVWLNSVSQMENTPFAIVEKG